MDIATKLLNKLGNEKLSVTSIRRLMRNELAAMDVDRLLTRLVQDHALIIQDGIYERYKNPNNPVNWE